MGPQEDYIETVVTCEGDFHDPQLPHRLEFFRRQLKDLLLADPQKQVIVKKVEPWNSVRVTLNIPRQAALRLKQLAEQGSARLRQLGVLAVQIEGDHLVSLTLATTGNQRTELILRTAASSAGLSQTAAGASGAVFDSGLPSSSDELGSPGPTNVEVTRKNIEEYLRQGSSLFHNSVLTPATTASTNYIPASSNDVFKTPSIVEASVLRSGGGGNDKVSVASNILGSSALSGLHQRLPVPPPSHGIAAETGTFPQPLTNTTIRQGQQGAKAVGIHTTVQTMTTPSQAMALPQTASVGFNMMCLPPPPPYPHSQGASSGVANHIGRQGRKVTASSPLLINLLQTEPMAASSSPSNSKGLSAGQGSIDKPKKKRRVRQKKDTGTLTQSGGSDELISDSTSSSVIGSVVPSSSYVGDSFSAKVSVGGSVNVNSSGGHNSETSMDTSSTPAGVDDAVVGRGSLQISSGFSQLGGESIINPYTGHMEPRELASDLSPLRGEPAPLHSDAPEGSGVDMAVLTSSPTTTSPPSSTITGSSSVIPPLASGIVDSTFKDSQQRNFPSPPLVSVPQPTHPHVDLMELRRRQHPNESLGKSHAPGGGMPSQAYAQHRSSPLPSAVTQPPPLAVLELHNPLPAVVANHPQSSVNGLTVSTPSVTVPANGDSLGEMHLGSSGILTASPASVVPVSKSELSRLSSEPVQNKEFESCVTDSASDVSAKSSNSTDDVPAPQPDVLVANAHPFLAQGRTECAAVASLHHSLHRALIKSSVTAENPSLALLNMSPAPAVLSPPQAVQRVAVGDSASVGTASPTGSKTLSEGDDSSNHSCIGPDGPSDATSAGTALLDGATTKVYNNDSGVGSSSERSDDTPSEAGDGEYHSGTGVLGDGTAAEGGSCTKQVIGGNKGIVNCEPSTSKPDSHLTIGFVHNSQIAPGMLNRKDAIVSALQDAAAMGHQHSQSSASAEKSIPADSDEMLMKSVHPVASSSQGVPILNKGMPSMAVQYLSSAHPDVHQQISHHKNRVANCQVSGVHQNGPVLLPHAHAPEQPLSSSQGNSLPHLISSYTSGIQVSSLPHTPGSSVPHSAGSSVLQPSSMPHARGISGTGTTSLALAHPGGKPGVHVTSPAPSTSTMPRLPYMQGVTLSCASTHSPSITVSRTQSLAVSHTHMSVLSSSPTTSVACAVGPVTTSITGTTQNCVLSSGHNTDIKTAVVNITDSSKSNAIVPVTVMASSKQHGFSVATVTTATITTPTATGSRLHHKHPAAAPHSTDLMDTSSLEAAVSLPEMMVGTVGEASDLDVLEEAHQLFYGNSGEATSLSSFDEDLMLASHPTRDNGMVGYLEAGGRHSSSNGNGSMSIGSVGGGTISAEVRNANITSMYCKRSSPVNVNMLNHIYAPGLPLPRRLTESVQRLVKPLPTTETALPPVRACKSPGASSSRHSTNGSTSPGRASQGGARSPGASLSSARVLSFDKAPVGPSNNMAVLPSNMARGSYHPAQYSEHSGCDLNSMHSSSLKTGVAPHLQSANPSTAVAVPNAQSYASASTCFSQQPSTSGICTQSHGGFPQLMGPCAQTPWSGPHNPAPGTGGRLQPPPPPLVSSTSATLTTQVHPPSTSTPHLYHHHISGKNSAMSHPASHIPQLLPLSTSAFHPATTASVVVTTSSVHGLCASMTSSEQVPEVSLVPSQTTITTPGGSIISGPSHPLPPPPVLVQRAPSPSVPVCTSSQSGSLDWGATSEDSPTQASSFALSHPSPSASFIKQASPHAASSVTTIAVPVTATATAACVSGVEGLQAAVLTSASVVSVSAVAPLASTAPFTTSDGALGTAGVALFTSVNPNLASDSPSTGTVYMEKNPTQTVDSQPTSIEHFYSSAHTQAAEGRSHGSKISEGHDTVACAELLREPGHENGQGVGSLAAAKVMSSVSGQEASITTADFSNLTWSQPASANHSHDLHFVTSEHASNFHHNLDTALVPLAPDAPVTKVQDSNVEDMCKVLVTSSHSVPAVGSCCTTACNSGISTNNAAVSIAELASGDTHSASDLHSSTAATVDSCTTVMSKAHGLLKHVHADAVVTNMHIGTIASAQESSVANIHLGPAAQNVPSTSTQGTDDTGHNGLLTNMHRSSSLAANNFQVNNTASSSVSSAFVTSEHAGSVLMTQTTLEVTSVTAKTLVPHTSASVTHTNSQDAASLESVSEVVVVPDITKNHVSLVALAQKAAAQASALKNLAPDRLARAVTPIHLKASAPQSSPAAELCSVVVPDACSTGDAGKEAYVDGEGSWGQGAGMGSNEGLVASTQPPVLSLSSAATPMPEEVENSSFPLAENPHSRPPLLHPAPLLSSAPTIVPSATPPPPSLTPVLQEFGKKDSQMPSCTSQSSKPDGAPSDVAVTAKHGDKEAVAGLSDSLEEASTKTRRITRKRRSTQSESDSGEPAPKLNSVEPEAIVTALDSGIVTKQTTESGKAIVWDQPPRLSREGKKSSGSSGFSGDEKDKASSKTSSSNNDAAHHHHFERNIIEATPEEIAKKNAASSAGRRRAFYAYVLEKSLGQSYFDTPVLCGRTRSQSSTTAKDSNTATTTAATAAPLQIPQIAGTSASQNAQGHKEDTEVTTPGSKRSTRSLRTKDSTDVSGSKRKRAKEHR